MTISGLNGRTSPSVRRLNLTANVSSTSDTSLGRQDFVESEGEKIACEIQQGCLRISIR